MYERIKLRVLIPLYFGVLSIVGPHICVLKTGAFYSVIRFVLSELVSIRYRER